MYKVSAFTIRQSQARYEFEVCSMENYPIAFVEHQKAWLGGFARLYIEQCSVHTMCMILLHINTFLVCRTLHHHRVHAVQKSSCKHARQLFHVEFVWKPAWNYILLMANPMTCMSVHQVSSTCPSQCRFPVPHSDAGKPIILFDFYIHIQAKRSEHGGTAVFLQVQ